MQIWCISQRSSTVESPTNMNVYTYLTACKHTFFAGNGWFWILSAQAAVAPVYCKRNSIFHWLSLASGSLTSHSNGNLEHKTPNMMPTAFFLLLRYQDYYPTFWRFWQQQCCAFPQLFSAALAPQGWQGSWGLAGWGRATWVPEHLIWMCQGCCLYFRPEKWVCMSIFYLLLHKYV